MRLSSLTPEAYPMKSMCRALLVLNVLYCLLAAAQDGLPGWHMFESVERLPPVTDRDGNAVDYRKYLPKDAWLTDRKELEEIASFVCKKEPHLAPIHVGEKVLCAPR